MNWTERFYETETSEGIPSEGKWLQEWHSESKLIREFNNDGLAD